MGRVEATQDGEIPQLGEPIGSFTPKFQEQKNQAIGSPWSTGLFDCHEHQTNGWNGILAEQEGRRHHDQTVAVPPPKQAMYT
uniref:Uncharacterized protein n=1 Tax=Quercus lobata TaxID=97700 RepID=A0A7N2LN79_QUELO